MQPGWFLFKISKKNQTVWVSSKAVYNFAGSMKFNWVLLLYELSYLCSPLPSPLHMISRCPVSNVKLWQLYKYISYVRCSLYVGEYNKIYWNSSLWSKTAINVLVLKHKLQCDTAMWPAGSGYFQSISKCYLGDLGCLSQNIAKPWSVNQGIYSEFLIMMVFCLLFKSIFSLISFVVLCYDSHKIKKILRK